jgi:hypothetical protein
MSDKQRAMVSLRLTPYELQVVNLALKMLAKNHYTPLTKIISLFNQGDSVTDARETAQEIVDQIGLR